MGFQKSQPAGAATLVSPSASTGPPRLSDAELAETRDQLRGNAASAPSSASKSASASASAAVAPPLSPVAAESSRYSKKATN